MGVAAGTSPRPGQAVIEPASASDRAFLPMDTGAAPEQFGVILTLDDGGGAVDPEHARRLRHA